MNTHTRLPCARMLQCHTGCWWLTYVGCSFMYSSRCSMVRTHQQCEFSHPSTVAPSENSYHGKRLSLVLGLECTRRTFRTRFAVARLGSTSHFSTMHSPLFPRRGESGREVIINRGCFVCNPAIVDDGYQSQGHINIVTLRKLGKLLWDVMEYLSWKSRNMFTRTRKEEARGSTYYLHELPL